MVFIIFPQPLVKQGGWSPEAVDLVRAEFAQNETFYRDGGARVYKSRSVWL
jgi:hypothetical protein